MNRITLNSKNKNNSRELFSRQSARAILIDLCLPFNADIGKTLKTAIDRFFALTSCLNGPVRVPFITLVIMSKYNETLLPLQRVTKATYQKIFTSLQALFQILDDYSQPLEFDIKLFDEGITEIANNFSRQKASIGPSTLLDITVFTSQSKAKIQQAAQQTLVKLNLSEIKKVNFVCLKEERGYANTGLDADFELDLSQTHDNFDKFKDNNVVLTGIYDIQTINCEEFALEAYFRNWLHDESTDKEHIQLKIGKLMLKCDMQECMINPAEIPLRSIFFAGQDACLFASQNRPASQSTPVLQLKAIKTVLNKNICESVLFGSPFVIRSSSCWQMEWEELERNQNLFIALCSNLMESNKCIILENRTTNFGQHRNYSYSNVSTNGTRGIFTLVPCGKSSLLLKSIVARDLLLPLGAENSQCLSDVMPKAKQDILLAMDQLSHDDMYNPLTTECDLITNLQNGLLNKSQIQNNTGSCRGGKRPRNSF